MRKAEQRDRALHQAAGQVLHAAEPKVFSKVPLAQQSVEARGVNVIALSVQDCKTFGLYQTQQ